MHVVSPAGNPRRAARQRFHHFSWPGAPHAVGTKSWSDICASPHPSFAGSTGCSIMCSLLAASDAAPPLGRSDFCTASVDLAKDSVVVADDAGRQTASGDHSGSSTATTPAPIHSDRKPTGQQHTAASARWQHNSKSNTTAQQRTQGHNTRQSTTRRLPYAHYTR